MSNEGIFNNGIQMPVQLQKVNEPVDWPHYRIQAAIAAMQGMLANPAHHKVQVESGVPFSNFYGINAVHLADALVAEMKRSDDVYAECRRMDAINTASVCENMTKIQKELQKKEEQD